MEATETRKALLIVDLQQDFISPNGPFKDTHVKADHIISNLRVVLPHFREQNGIVIWIKSDYSTPDFEPKYLTRPEGKQYEGIPMNNDYLSGTHTTFPLCISGKDGAKFIDEVYSLMDEKQDQVVCKKYYSAFTNTNLADILKEMKEIHICGITTNTCVQATTTDAFFHGFKVFIWTDCLGYRSKEKHEKALSNMQRWYATLTSSDICFKESSLRK